MKTIFATITDFIESMVFCLAIFSLIYLFLFRPTEVQGASMQPSLETGQRLITEQISYKFNPPQRGDIVVVKSPENKDIWLVKRIIGIPGDLLTIKDGAVYINDKKLEEDYLDSPTEAVGVFITDQGYLVNSDEYVVMGDNRNNSNDSRFFGPIKKEDIVGKAVFRFWPPQDFGILSNPVYN